MRNKKGLAIFIITVLIFNIFTMRSDARVLKINNSEIANKFNILKEQAIDTAAKIMPDMRDITSVKVDLIDDWGRQGSKLWNVMLSPENNSSGLSENVNVDVNTGEVRSFGVTKNYSLIKKIFLPTYTKEEMKKIVENKILELQPKLINQIECVGITSDNKNSLDGLKAPISYTFNYSRKIGKQLYNRDGFKVIINSYDGTISYYEFSWLNENLPDVNTILSIDKAGEEFLKYGEPRIMYVRPWIVNNTEENRKLKLIYSIVNGPYYYFDFNAIDAKSGKPLNSQGKETNVYSQRIGEVSKLSVNKKIEKLQHPINENDAKLIAIKEALKYNISVDSNDDYKSTYTDNWFGLPQKAYNISFTKKSETSAFSFNATIDLLTGCVLEFHYGNDKLTTNISTGSAINTSSVSWQDGKNRAIAFVKSKFPQFLGSIVLMENEPNFAGKSGEFDYYYSFWRTVNGVLYPENNLNILVDNKSGNIEGYGYRWEFIDFPEIGKDIITEDTAANIFINQIGLKINYLSDAVGNGVFAYGPIANEAAYIDAYTGKIKDNKGNDVVDLSQKYDLGVSTNYPREVNIFNELGIIDGNEKTNLDNNITIGRFVKMLVMLNGDSSSISSGAAPNSFDKYSNSAINMGWIKDKGNYNSDILLNLNDMTDILMRIASIDKSAKTSGEDAIIFLKGLNIIKDGNYNWNRNISLRDAINAIYNSIINK